MFYNSNSYLHYLPTTWKLVKQKPDNYFLSLLIDTIHTQHTHYAQDPRSMAAVFLLTVFWFVYRSTITSFTNAGRLHIHNVNRDEMVIKLWDLLYSSSLVRIWEGKVKLPPTLLAQHPREQNSAIQKLKSWCNTLNCLSWEWFCGLFLQVWE